MDNLRGLWDIRMLDGIANGRIRELCGVTKMVDGRMDENALRWFSHM